MRYGKPALAFDKQIELLRSRGMEGDPAFMRDRLSTVNYYRLTGYWHPFRLPNSDHFRPGTTFERVWERYVFDRKLRLVVMDAIERIEVATRTQISYHHGLAYGPFGYAENASSLPAFSQNEYAEFRRRVDEDVGRAREVFVDHFRQKYGDTHGSLPIWVASEVLSFGLVIRMVRNAPNAVTKPVAAAFGVSRNVLESWLLTTNTVRNICAHHGRLWNRELGTQPKLPPDWRPSARQLESRRLYPVLAIFNHSLGKVSPGSGWAGRLVGLLDAYPGFPLVSMGFPTAWRTDPLWANIKPAP